MMKARFRPLWLCAAALLPVLLSGCGGLHATGSVSPIDFLLPGAGKLLRVEKAVPQQHTASVTNGLVAVGDLVLDHSASE